MSWFVDIDDALAGQLAQSVRHRNGSPMVPGSSPGLAAHFSSPVTYIHLYNIV